MPQINKLPEEEVPVIHVAPRDENGQRIRIHPAIYQWNEANKNAQTKVIGIKKRGKAQMGPKSASPISQKSLITMNKGVQALEMRLAGFSLSDIAEQLDYANEAGAHRLLESMVAKVMVEPVQHVRELELMRLDKMLSAIWARVIQGELKAMGMALQIMDRRANLLGLNQIRQMDMTVWIRKEAELRGLDAVSIMTEVQALVNQLPAYVNEPYINEPTVTSE